MEIINLKSKLPSMTEIVVEVDAKQVCHLTIDGRWSHQDVLCEAEIDFEEQQRLGEALATRAMSAHETMLMSWASTLGCERGQIFERLSMLVNLARKPMRVPADVDKILAILQGRKDA